jgi:hypothetical protein
MSRAFGNRLLKQFVVAEPEIQVTCACMLVFDSSPPKNIDWCFTAYMSNYHSIIAQDFIILSGARNR